MVALAVPMWGTPAPGSVPQAFEQTAAVPEAGAKAVSGGIEVYNNSGAEVAAEIYSITGTMLTRLDLAPGEALRVDLNAGIYIVRVANHAVRLLVR